MDAVITATSLPHQYHLQPERTTHNMYDKLRQRARPTAASFVPSATPRGGTVDAMTISPLQFSSTSSSTVLRCTCCPYGYHIDLGFLGFLEQSDNLAQLRKVHRRRTIQRQKMETNLLMPGRPEQLNQHHDTSDDTSTPSSLRSDDEDYNGGESDTAATSRLLKEIDASIIDALSSIDVLMKSKPTAAVIDNSQRVRDRSATVYDNDVVTPISSTDSSRDALGRQGGVWVVESSSSSSVTRRSAWSNRGQIPGNRLRHPEMASSSSTCSSGDHQPRFPESPSLQLTPEDGSMSMSAFTGTFSSLSSTREVNDTSCPSSVFTSFNDDLEQSPPATQSGMPSTQFDVRNSVSKSPHDKIALTPPPLRHTSASDVPAEPIAERLCRNSPFTLCASLQEPTATNDKIILHVSDDELSRTKTDSDVTSCRLLRASTDGGSSILNLVQRDSRDVSTETSRKITTELGLARPSSSTSPDNTSRLISVKLRPLRTTAFEQRIRPKIGDIQTRETASRKDASTIATDNSSCSSPERGRSAAESMPTVVSSVPDDSIEIPQEKKTDSAESVYNERCDGVLASSDNTTESFKLASTSNKLSSVEVKEGTTTFSNVSSANQQQQHQHQCSSAHNVSVSQVVGNQNDLRFSFQFPVSDVDNVDVVSPTEPQVSSSEQLARAMAILMPIETSSLSSTSDLDSRSSSAAASPASTIDPDVLIDLRRQIAASLQQMRFLERQVKAIPMLQIRLSVLKEEKRLLQLQLMSTKNIAAAMVAPPPLNVDIRRHDAGVQAVEVYTETNKEQRIDVGVETESCYAMHNEAPRKYMCSKCRACFHNVNDLHLVEPSSVQFTSISEHERPQQQHEQVGELSQKSSVIEFPPSANESISMSSLSTATSALSGNGRRCRVVVDDKFFSDDLGELISSFSVRPSDARLVSSVDARASPDFKPPIAPKEISIGLRDDKLKRRNVGIQCIRPTLETSRIKFERQNSKSESSVTVTMETAKTINATRICRRGSIGQEPDLVVAHLTATETGTVNDDLEVDASKSMVGTFVEKSSARESFYRKPDLIETGVNTDYVRIMSSSVCEKNVDEDDVASQSSLSRSGDEDDSAGRQISEFNAALIAHHSAITTTGERVQVTESSSSTDPNRDNAPVNISTSAGSLRHHTETQTDISGPVMTTATSDVTTSSRTDEPPSAACMDLASDVSQADDHVTKSARSAGQSPDGSKGSWEWSISCAVPTNVNNRSMFFESVHKTSSFEYHGINTGTLMSADDCVSSVDSDVWNTRHDAMSALSYLDLHPGHRMHINRDVPRFVRNQFEQTRANGAASVTYSVCTGSRSAGGPGPIDDTVIVNENMTLLEACDVACNTSPVSLPMTTDATTITDYVPDKPMTVETGCDPHQFDACDLYVDFNLTSTKQDHELKRVENDKLTPFCVNTTSLLPTPRPQTTDVASETEFTLNLALSAAIACSPAERTFNDTACNTDLAASQTVDSASNTDDVTSGRPTLTTDFSCSVNIAVTTPTTDRSCNTEPESQTVFADRKSTREASSSTDKNATSDVTCNTDHVTMTPQVRDSSSGTDVDFKFRVRDATCNTNASEITLKIAEMIEIGMNTDAVVILSADVPETRDIDTNTDVQTIEARERKTVAISAKPDVCECACEANLVHKPDVIDMASNTETAERDLLNSACNVDQTTEHVTEQSRAIAIVKAQKTNDDDYHVSYSDNSEHDIASKSSAPHVTDSGWTSADSAVRLVRPVGEKSTTSITTSFNDVGTNTDQPTSPRPPLNESEGLSDTVVKPPSCEVACNTESETTSRPLVDITCNTSHRKSIDITLGKDCLDMSIDGDSIYSEWHRSGTGKDTRVTCTTTTEVQATTLTRDADCNTDVLPSSVLVKPTVADAMCNTDGDYTLPVDDVTEGVTSQATSYRSSDHRRSLDDVKVSVIDIENIATTLVADEETGLEWSHWTGENKNKSASVVCDASCNTDETRMSSTSSNDVDQRQSTDLDLDDRPLPPFAVDSMATFIENNVTTGHPVCLVPKPTVRDAACSTDITETTDAGCITVICGTPSTKDSSCGGSADDDDDDNAVLVKLPTSDAASNTDLLPSHSEVACNTDLDCAVTPEVVDFACGVDFTRMPSSTCDASCSTDHLMLDERPSDIAGAHIVDPSDDGFVSKTFTYEQVFKVSPLGKTTFTDTAVQRQAKIDACDRACNTDESWKIFLDNATSAEDTATLHKIDSASNTDDVTSGVPTLTADVSCIVNIAKMIPKNDQSCNTEPESQAVVVDRKSTREASASTDKIATSDVTCNTDHVTMTPQMRDSSSGTDVDFKFRVRDATCNTNASEISLKIAEMIEIGTLTDAVVSLTVDEPETRDSGINTDERVSKIHESETVAMYNSSTAVSTSVRAAYPRQSDKTTEIDEICCVTVSDFGCSVNIVVPGCSVTDASCNTDVMSSVEDAFHKTDLINIPVLTNSCQISMELLGTEANKDVVNGDDQSTPPTLSDFGCGVNMANELGTVTVVDASCNTDSTAPSTFANVEYTASVTTRTSPTASDLDMVALPASVPAIVLKVTMIEAESNTDPIRVLSTQEYEELSTILASMTSSAPHISSVITAALTDTVDATNRSPTYVACNTTTADQHHEDLCTVDRISDTLPSSSDVSRTIPPSSLIDRTPIENAKPEARDSASNTDEDAVWRPTAVDVSCGSDISAMISVVDVACGEELALEVFDAAVLVSAKPSSSSVGCATELQQSSTAEVIDVRNDAQEMSVNEAASNTEPVRCRRCMCRELTSSESPSETNSDESTEHNLDYSKHRSVSGRSSMDSCQVAEVACMTDSDVVVGSTPSDEIVTCDQSCNTEPEPESEAGKFSSSSFASFAEATEVTVDHEKSFVNSTGIAQLRHRRTLSSSSPSHSSTSVSTAATASKIPTRKRSTRTRDAADNTDVTIAPSTAAADTVKTILDGVIHLSNVTYSSSSSSTVHVHDDCIVDTCDKTMNTTESSVDSSSEMMKPISTRDFGCCASPITADVSCGSDRVEEPTTTNRIRRVSSESREKLTGRHHNVDSAIRKRPLTRNASCTADLGTSSMASTITTSVTSPSSLKTPTSDVACGTDFDLLSRLTIAAAATDDNDKSDVNRLSSATTPFAATDCIADSVPSGGFLRSRPRRLDLDGVRDVACNTEHDSKPVSGVMTSPYYVRGVSYFPPPVPTADVACETDPVIVTMAEAVAVIDVTVTSDQRRRSAPGDDRGELKAATDDRRYRSTGDHLDSMSAEKTLRNARLSFSEGSLAISDVTSRACAATKSCDVHGENVDVARSGSHKASPTCEALATLRQYIALNLQEQRKQLEAKQTAVKSTVTLCDVAVGPDESDVEDQRPSNTSTTTSVVGDSDAAEQLSQCGRPRTDGPGEVEDVQRTTPGETGCEKFYRHTVGDQCSTSTCDEVGEPPKDVSVQTDSVDELLSSTMLTAIPINRSGSVDKTVGRMADRKSKTTMNKAINTVSVLTRTKSINTMPLAFRTTSTMTDDQLDHSTNIANLHVTQIPTVTVEDFDTSSQFITSFQRQLVTRSAEDINNNSDPVTRVHIGSETLIPSVSLLSNSGTVSSDDIDDEREFRRPVDDSDVDVSRMTAAPQSGENSTASQLTRRWGTVDLSEEQQLPMGSASGGRKRSVTSVSCSSSSSSVAMTTTPFKSILKHSRSADTHRDSGSSTNSVAPRKAISFSQDVIFRGELEDDFVSDMNSSSFEGEVFGSTTTEKQPAMTSELATSVVELETSDDLSSACVTYALWLRDSTEVTSKQLNHSIKVIRNNWFAMTSQKKSHPEQVAGFLQRISELSAELLKQVVNMVDDNGNTSVHYAMSNGRFDIVRCLLDTGCCDIGRQNRTGCTAIMLASLVPVATDDDRQVIERLMSVGDVNQRAALAGQTALMLAASRDRGDIVRMLIDAGADVNAQDDDGSTAIMCASEHGFVDVVRILLGHPDCDPTIVDNEGSSATSIAIEAGHQDIALLLYAHSNFKKTSSGSKRRRLKSPRPSTPSDPKSPKSS